MNGPPIPIPGPDPLPTFSDHLAGMDAAFHDDLRVAAENMGFPDRRILCEFLAVAARLGEISLRERGAGILE